MQTKKQRAKKIRYGIGEWYGRLFAALAPPDRAKLAALSLKKGLSGRPSKGVEVLPSTVFDDNL